jgi:hypothetical protein
MTFIDVVAVIFAGATTIATGLSAFVLWRQWHGTIYAEWSVCWVRDKNEELLRTLEVSFTLRNNTQTGIRAFRVDAYGAPLKDLNTRNPSKEKDHSWPAMSAPLSLVILPGQSASAQVVARPDWSAIVARKSIRLFSRSRLILRIQVSVTSMVRNRRVARKQTTIEIPREMIESAVITPTKEN